jgi:phosphoglycolate phosphatase-like HAD superfamily hydrolase
VNPLVLFDLDNTLVDRRLTLADWAASFRERHGLDAEAESWLLTLLADRATPANFGQVHDRFSLAESPTALWSGYCADIAAAVICPPEVLAGLTQLRAAGWRVEVATNGATDIQRAKLRATGIAERVDAICISEEAGARKPEPAMFQEAIRRCTGAPRRRRRLDGRRRSSQRHRRRPSRRASHAYTSYQKASRVLAALAYGLADANGVADELLDIAGRRTGSYLTETGYIPKTAARARRWGPEMEEAAELLADASLPDDIMRAAAAVLSRWDAARDSDLTIAEALDSYAQTSVERVGRTSWSHP